MQLWECSKEPQFSIRDFCESWRSEIQTSQAQIGQSFKSMTGENAIKAAGRGEFLTAGCLKIFLAAHRSRVIGLLPLFILETVWVGPYNPVYVQLSFAGMFVQTFVGRSEEMTSFPNLVQGIYRNNPLGPLGLEYKAKVPGLEIHSFAFFKEEKGTTGKLLF